MTTYAHARCELGVVERPTVATTAPHRYAHAAHPAAFVWLRSGARLLVFDIGIAGAVIQFLRFRPGAAVAGTHTTGEMRSFARLVIRSQAILLVPT
jgi:hypothetical protein